MNLEGQICPKCGKPATCWNINGIACSSEHLNMKVEETITLCDGKYQFLLHAEGFHCLRYGKEWMSFTGDNAVLALFQRCRELEKENKAMQEWIDATR